MALGFVWRRRCAGTQEDQGEGADEFGSQRFRQSVYLYMFVGMNGSAGSAGLPGAKPFSNSHLWS
jgi:hypothetical protein